MGSGYKTSTASLIIPVIDDWYYTRVALESIKRYTKGNYEIIIVDNGSKVPLIDKVENFSKRNPEILVRYVRCERNLGFSGGCNRGIEVSTGDVIVILNNDLLVTPGWLESLSSLLFDSKANAGIVGPLSNYVAGAQLISDCPLRFDSPDDVDFGKLSAYSLRIKEENKGKYLNPPAIIGLCMAIRRDVIEAIGGFDERFYPGNFEDNDLCIRARHLGYSTLVSCETFVYHFGSKTFKSLKLEYEDTLRQNLLRFAEKWGIDPSVMSYGVDIHVEALKAEPKEERIVYPLYDEGIFVLGWDDKTWKRKIDYMLSHPYKSSIEIVIPVDGQNPQSLGERIEHYIKTKDVTSFLDVTLYSGRFEDLFFGVEGKKYVVLSIDEKGKYECFKREDVYGVFLC